MRLTENVEPGIIAYGGMAERLKAAVLKTARGLESLLGGSNPPPSAWMLSGGSEWATAEAKGESG